MHLPIDKGISIWYSQTVLIHPLQEGTDLGGHAHDAPAKLMHAMLDKQKKQRLIKKFQTHEGDTGSTEVQIAPLTAEIDELASHLKSHHKDHSSRRGLLRKVGERRRLLKYLQRENAASYEELVKKLKLKQAKQFIQNDDDIDEVDEAEDKGIPDEVSE